MLTSLLTATLVAATPTAGAAGAAIMPFGGASGWAEYRVPSLVAGALERLGIDVHDPAHLPSVAWSPDKLRHHGLEVVVTGRVRPAAPKDPSEEVHVDILLATLRGRTKVRLAGKADDLEALAARIAAAAARSMGHAASEEAIRTLSIKEAPFVVHKLLGEAEADLATGNARAAWMKFDRAAAKRNLGLLPEAVEGGRRARLLFSKPDPDLAASALEKANVYLRGADKRDAVPALVSFMRYTPNRALHWSVERPLDERSVLLTQDATWFLQPEGGPLLLLDPRTGAVKDNLQTIDGIAGVVQDHTVTVQAKRVARRDERGQVKWSLDLPFAPNLGPSNALHAPGGMAAMAGGGRVAWVDLGLGSIGQVAVGVNMVGVGPDGAAVTVGEGEKTELALLRPGREKPKWRTPIGAGPFDVVMPIGRVAVMAGDRVLIFDSRDGKARGSPFDVGPGARWIGANGRYGGIATADDSLLVLDILGGVQTARLKGPGRPIGFVGTASGYIAMFASSDVISYDRDGVMLDRAKVPGRPFALRPGPADAPGAVAMTTRGLFALGAVPAAKTALRDVDALAMLAELLTTVGDKSAAIRVANHGARRAVGRVDQFESIRAKLLEGEAAKIAKARCEIARQADQPLTAYREF